MKKFKIIVENIVAPIEEDINCVSKNNIYYHKCERINVCKEEECKPIKISLKELSSIEEPNNSSFWKSSIHKIVDSELYKSHIKSLQTLECSQPLQNILMEKLNEGVTEIGEDEFEINQQWSSNEWNIEEIKSIAIPLQDNTPLTLKTIERKTSVSREEIKQAFQEVHNKQEQTEILKEEVKELKEILKQKDEEIRLFIKIIEGYHNPENNI